MTIDSRTGEIRWPKPSGEQARPTITVTDAEGTTRSSAWTIKVGAEPFRFVDAVKGDDANAGTLEAPWKTLAKVKSSEAAGATVYFRTGVYKKTGMSTGGGDTWTRVEFNGRVHPVQWLAYPGEKPVIDNDYAASGVPGSFIRITGAANSPVYLDGLEVTNSRHIALQYGSTLIENSTIDGNFTSGFVFLERMFAMHLWRCCGVRTSDMHGHYFFLIGGVGIAGLVVFPPCTDTRSCVEDFCGFELFELISLGDQFWLV